MPKFTEIIAPKNFENVRNRIGEILTVELHEQTTLDVIPKVSVYNERIIAPDHTEGFVANVQLSQGSYSNQDQTQSDGEYTYFIDVYGNDMIKLQRVLGLIQAILQDAQYKTLDFPLGGAVMRRNVTTVSIATIEQGSANNAVMGRVTMVVACPEKTELLPGNGIVKEHYTTVNLHETDKGYLYIYEF
jgi:hypothetical protein